jgi:hypothetical protein
MSQFMIALVLACLTWLPACGTLIPATDASGEWTSVAVIVGLVLVIAIGVAAFRAKKDEHDE